MTTVGGYPSDLRASAVIEPGRAVALTGDRTVGPAGAGARAIGIAQMMSATFDVDNHAAVGDQVSIVTPGRTTQAVLGGTVVAGDALIPTTGGKLIAAPSSGAVSRPGGFVALEGGSLDEVIEVLVFGGSDTSGAIAEGFAFGDFTDGGAAAGTLQLATAVPAGSLVKAVAINVTTEFSGTGVSTATAQFGDGTDADRFSEEAALDLTSVALVGSSAPADGANAFCASDTNITITATEDSDFGQIDAGAGTAFVWFERLFIPAS